MEEKPESDEDRSDDTSSDDGPSTDTDAPVSYHKSLAAGYTLVGGLLVGLGIGYLLDLGFGTKPLWTICGALLFMFAGLYQVVKDSLK